METCQDHDFHVIDIYFIITLKFVNDTITSLSSSSMASFQVWANDCISVATSSEIDIVKAVEFFYFFGSYTRYQQVGLLFM